MQPNVDALQFPASNDEFRSDLGIETNAEVSAARSSELVSYNNAAGRLQATNLRLATSEEDGASLNSSS